MSDKPTKRMTKRDLAHMSKIATRDPAHRELIESAVSEIKILSGTLVRCQSLAIRIGWLESKPQDIVKTARRLQDEFIKALDSEAPNTTPTKARSDYFPETLLFKEDDNGNVISVELDGYLFVRDDAAEGPSAT